MLILILFAFLGGVVTILSPCILPIMPIVLAGSLGGGKSRPFGVVTGFILSFTFFTLFSFALLKFLGLSGDVLRTVAFIALLFFGIAIFIPQIQLWLEKKLAGTSTQVGNITKHAGFGSGFLLGISLGLVWTPCVGPILASVITLAATSAVTVQAVFVTFAYAVGTAVPMLLIIYGGRGLLQRVPWLTSHTRQIQKVFGVIIILVALAIAFNLDRTFQVYILQAFPQYGAGLTQFEDNPEVRKQLEDMGPNSGFRIQDSELITQLPMYPLAPNPNFDGATKWLNTEPLTLEKLKGKVVLVDFWTYTCINCIRTFPYLTDWYKKYQDDGLVIIGVHSPEFAFEKEEDNVRKAMKDYGITYPVVQDNDFLIWQSYNNRFWPAEYFIDKNGRLRRTHFGEGNYEESEKFIQELLKEDGTEVNESLSNVPDNAPKYALTPEIYLGYDRIEYLTSPESIKKDTPITFSIPQKVLPSRFAYSGEWTLGNERAMPQKGAILTLNFQAKEVYLVMRTSQPNSKIKVMLDGQTIPPNHASDDIENGEITVTDDRLYRLVKLEKPENHTLTLEFIDDTVELYAFTFG